MTDFLSYQFFVGIILGGLIVLVTYPLFKKKNQTDSFKDNLDEMGKNIKSLQEDNLKYQGSISEKLKFFINSGENFEKIANEMKNTLVAGSSQKQGAWGEMVLEHILTKLQFTEGEEFEKHKNFKSEEGDKLIPDFIVHFPGKRDVIIDSKVNLTAWDEYVNSDNKEDKEEALSRHKLSIKAHIDGLSKKNYKNIEDINTLDSVIMFCPNEAAISSLGSSSRKMMDYAIEKKITLIGPSMLYFTLKTVEYFWKAERQSKNTKKIIELANKISSQSVEIYDSAKVAIDGIAKTSKGVEGIMMKIKGGRGSFLSKIDSMNKIGGLSPKKPLPNEVQQDLEEDILTIENKSKIDDE